jgi:hypothetical protein
MIPWCINQFFYASITNSWSFIINGLVLHKAHEIVIPTSLTNPCLGCNLATFSRKDLGLFTIHISNRCPISTWKYCRNLVHCQVTLCRNPSLRFTTKTKGLARLRAKKKLGSHTACFWECRKVWGNELSHSQGNSHFGRWSSGGLPKLQRAIVGVKTQWIEEFLISLESSWNLDVQNELAWPIWTSKTQVMAKRRVGSQIDSLTVDH